uniref:Uncharacterized protein n=1 Tax=Anopheles minimus TaxID=112268 RepID=A0A182WPI7_9DIPT
MRTHPAASSHG